MLFVSITGVSHGTSRVTGQPREAVSTVGDSGTSSARTCPYASFEN